MSESLDNVLDADVLLSVALERRRQDEKFGFNGSHPDGTSKARKFIADEARSQCEMSFAMGQGTWLDILQEEVMEAFAEEDPDKLEAELIQVAAVAVAWVADIRRRRETAYDRPY